MSSTKDTVTIIVPVYNGERTIAKCLDSLVHQDYEPALFDIVVVENGSTDQSKSIIEQFPVILVQCEKKGPAYARNFGAKYSQADILAFTDADCIADPNWLRELVKPYSQNQDIAGCGGRIEAAIDQYSTVEEQFCQKKNLLCNYLSGSHEYLPHLYTANASYRKAIFDLVGGFNSNLLTAEDVDLSWRVQLISGKQLEYVDQAIIYHHHRSTRKALARQYRQYGFGEILIDTLYRDAENYPRALGYQLRLIGKQILAIITYISSMIIRSVRRLVGKIDEYTALEPCLNLLVEWNNIIGKFSALWATRAMSSVEIVFKSDPNAMINRFYGNNQRGVE